MRTALALLLVLAAAALLRLPALDERPMHADEAVLAWKFAPLLESGDWRYDPQGHHGPALHYLSLPAARLRGQSTLGQLDETTLRLTPAVLGILLCLLPFAVQAELGREAAALGGLVLAVSPAFVYYSRDFIPETPLLFFTAAAVVCVIRWRRHHAFPWAIAAGIAAGIAMAAKETWILSAGAAFLALLAARALRFHRHLLVAAAAALLISSLLYTSLLRHPEALAGGWLALTGVYPHRAFEAGSHEHPWWFYAHLLGSFHLPGSPWFSEAGILLFAAWGAWKQRSTPLVRFLVLYGSLLALIYSLLPYKTPWCLLQFWFAFCWLAGIGIASLANQRLLQALLTLPLLGHLAFQANLAARPLSASPANPYVYAQTLPDIYLLRDALAPLPESTRIQMISPQNLWPLPWYLRRFSHQEWSRQLPPGAPAPLVLLTPEGEAAFVRRAYEEMPPGSRNLYVPVVQPPIFLRPGVEIRAYLHSHRMPFLLDDGAQND